MKSRTHSKRKDQRRRRLRELIRERQVEGKRFGNHWRINHAFDYWPNSGRVLDRRDPERWTAGYVSSPDEMVAVVRGIHKLRNARTTRRLLSWKAPWCAPKPES